MGHSDGRSDGCTRRACYDPKRVNVLQIVVQRSESYRELLYTVFYTGIKCIDFEKFLQFRRNGKSDRKVD